MNPSQDSILFANAPIEMFISSGGGKAKNLALLSQLGKPVPQWFCITTAGLDDFIRVNGIEQRLQLQGPPTPERIRSFAQEIESLFIRLPIPEPLEEAIRTAMGKIHCASDSPVAIRSSGIDEDSEDHSFAGQFSSFLSQRGIAAILISIKKCWASAFSERALSYRMHRGLSLSSIRMGVVIQRMMEPQAAGVAFSRDPIHPMDREHALINSVFGLGEGLVSGELDADAFWVHREQLTLTRSEIAHKTHQVVREETGGIRTVEVDSHLQKAPSLSEDTIRSITQLCVELENQLGAPQDIEWVLQDDKVYLVQTRPITSLPPENFFNAGVGGDAPILWDNSNIIESFCGVTTPLTFSHVSRAYRQVYLQFCEFMGVPPQLIADHEPMFRNMLGLVRGRIYYNLGNWYRMIFLFPGSATNKGFMETMMGVKQGLKPEVARLFDFVSRPPEYTPIQRVRILIPILIKVLRVRKLVDQFKSDVDRVYLPAKKVDFTKLSFQQQIEYYQMLEREFLLKWKAPIVSDTRCMVFFGILKSLTAKWIQGVESSSLQNDLLCGQGDLPSTEPTRWLIRIAAQISQGDDAFKKWFATTPPRIIWHELSNEKFRTQWSNAEAIHGEFLRYLDVYGFRSVNELKFEEPDLHMDPSIAIEATASYVRSGNISVEEMERKERAIRERAERTVRSQLSGLKLRVYLFFVRQARLAVRDREDLRFLRTNTFGITRRLFLGMGHQLRLMGVIQEARDVFYLTMDEMIAFSEGRSLLTDFKTLVRVRQEEFDTYRKTPAPPDRILTQGPAALTFRYPSVLADSDLLKQDGETTASDPNRLKGIPCSPGVVEGIIRVVRSPADAEALSGEILVAERTDPGWIPLFPSCSGLLIERGSQLSHSAVVAREMGIPTIVGVSGGLMNRLQSGMKVRMNASNGEIEIL